MEYSQIKYIENGPVGMLTLNRPDDGNMFTEDMCHEIRECINGIRRETRTRVLVITGEGEKFFCIGGRKEGMEDTNLYPGVLPTLEMKLLYRSRFMQIIMDSQLLPVLL